MYFLLLKIGSTHTDKAHTHSHIVINSTSLNCTKKFRNFKGSSFAIRRIADKLCIENGLSIVENPKLSKGGYNRWDNDNRPPANRDRLMDIIDAIIRVGMTLTEFFTALIKVGCEVKYKKHIAIKIPGAKKNIRLDSLGADYSHEAILERLAGKRTVAPREKASASLNLENKPSLLVDIEEKMRQGKGGGYRHWASGFNLQQMAKTLMFIKENGMDSYDDLVREYDKISAEYHCCLNKIKAAESRMNEITELQKYIGQYGKTREVYKQYKASNWSRKFYDQHETDIILHRAAKKYFNDNGYGKDKKLPKMDALKQEWATLNAEKKKLYVGYKELKEKHSAFLTAKANAENVLGINKTHRSQDRHRNSSHEI